MSKIPARVLWQRTLLIYRSDWKQHFLTALPLAILSAAIYVAGNAVLHEVSRGFRISGGFNHTLWIVLARTLAVRIPEFGLPWVLTTIAYAAVSANILAKGSPRNDLGISDSYTSARERLGPLLRIGTFTFLSMLAGYAIVAVCEFGILISSMMPSQNRLILAEAVMFVGLSLWAGLVSRAALSVPILMTSDNRILGSWGAIKKSIKMSEGYEPYFILLVAQTLLFSFLGPWTGRQMLLQLWSRGSVSANAYEWIGYSLDALVPAAIETFAFVGFTVLYMELLARGSSVQIESTEGAGAIPISPR